MAHLGQWFSNLTHTGIIWLKFKILKSGFFLGDDSDVIVWLYCPFNIFLEILERQKFLKHSWQFKETSGFAMKQSE